MSYASTDPQTQSLARAIRDVAALSPEVEAEIVAQFVARTVKSGAYLLRPGDVCGGIGFLVRGLLVAESVHPKETHCDVFIEGDFVTDYVSFLTECPAEGGIRAEEDSAYLWLDRKSLNRLYAEVHGAEHLGRRVAEARYISAVRRTSDLLTKTPAQRYAALVDDNPGWIQRVPQHVVARWLGITPESLSRIRQRASKD